MIDENPKYPLSGKYAIPTVKERKDLTIGVRNTLCLDCGDMSGNIMLDRVRASLLARLEGRNEGGDTEVMRLVDEIVKKALDKQWNTLEY